MPLKHFKTSLKPDSSDTSIIQPSDWNHDHVMDEFGVVYGETANAGIKGVGAGQNYLRYFRRKFNASTKEEYEFVSPLELRCSDYNFSQTGSGTLTANVTSVITLTPVPLGINGTNINHQVLITDGVGGNEVVKITGGTAISGAATGNLIVTSKFNHTNYSIKSATFGIQEAVYMLTDQDGGIIKVPSGRWTLYSGVFIGKNNVKISGCGFYSSFLNYSLFTDEILFNFDGTNTTSGVGTSNSIEYLTISGNVLANYTKPAVSLSNQVKFWGRYLNLSLVAAGVTIQDTPSSDANTFENVIVGFFRTNGFEILGGNSTIFDKTQCVTGQNATNSGYLIKKTGELYLNRAMVFGAYIGYNICPNATDVASHLWVSNCIIDNCSNYGISIQPTNGGLVSDVVVVNSYSSYSKQGLFINGIQGKIYNIDICAHRFILNKEHGVSISGPNVKNVLIQNSIIDSNGYSANETYDGIYVDVSALVDGLMICNNVIGVDDSMSHNMRSGINLGYPGALGPINNIMICNNKIDENVGNIGGIASYMLGFSNASFTNAVVKDNIPSNNQMIKMVKVGPEGFLGNGARDILYVDTSDTIDGLFPTWYGREVLIIPVGAITYSFTLAAKATSFRAAKTITGAAGDSITAKYDGSRWILRKG